MTVNQCGDGVCFLAFKVCFSELLDLGNTSLGELAFRQVYYWLSVADIC